ncbi:MAG: hemolysin family protein [Candidatus Omnitrophica bacterium]|nr:hemolysin family protein [Candidatus Omnitrophota bacterium]
MSNLAWIFLEGFLFVLTLGISAFFSAAETALTSISAVRINQIAGLEDHKHPLHDWLRNPTKYLTTILVGNNISNIAGALLVGDFFRRLIIHFGYPDEEALAGGLAFVTATTLVLVFGEIIPKSYSRHHCERVAPRLAPSVSFIYRILQYPIRLFMIISNLIIRLFGGEKAYEVPFVTADDLKLMIEVGEKQGLLDIDEREMLHSIFELSETHVREVMTPRVEMIYVKVNDPIESVLDTFEKHDFSRLPVIEDNRDNVVGILYMKDVLHHIRTADSSDTDLVRNLMRPRIFVPENKRVDDVLKQFQREKTHMAIVVDEYGGTSGLVTIEDILEEIVGEIHDEFDEDENEISQVGENAWIVDATVHPEDLFDELGVPFQNDKEEYDSLAGFLLRQMRDLPKNGDKLDFDTFRFTILEADEKRITRVRIDRLKEKSPAEMESLPSDE